MTNFQNCLIWRIPSVLVAVSVGMIIRAPMRADEQTPTLAAPPVASDTSASVLVPHSPRDDAGATGGSTDLSEQTEPPAKDDPTTDSPGETAPTQSPGTEQPVEKDAPLDTKQQGDPEQPTAEQSPPEKKIAEPTTAEPTISALTFRGIEAGRSTKEDVEKQWGTPPKTTVEDGFVVLLYDDIKPFELVDVIVKDDTVESIIIQLTRPASPVEISKLLKLDHLVPVTVPDRFGQPLGISYPERSTLLGIDPNAKGQQIRQIVLEPIGAEPFLLRAMYDKTHNYARCISDLDYVIQFTPQDALPYWMKAQTLAELGQLTEALKTVNTALKLEPKVPEYRLTRAQIVGQLGQYKEAVQLTESVLNTEGILPETRARALCQLGDLIAGGPAPDFEKSTKLHVEAIAVAAPLSLEKRFAVRRTAKDILIDAHLGVALDIASGNWRRQEEVVPKWLNCADALAKDIVANEAADVSVHLLVSRKSLAAYAALNSTAKATDAAETTIRLSQTLKKTTNDPKYPDHLAWQLGNAFVDVLRLAHAHGRHQPALRYGLDAVKLLEEIAVNRERTPSQKLLFAELYFLMGSVYAVFEEDHKLAVGWFDKSTKILKDPLPKISGVRSARMGDWCVSMGVSYWHTGDRGTGLELTEKGSQLLEEAVEGKVVDRNVLTIPYGNLANMYLQQGNSTAAKRYNELAGQLTPPDQPKRQ